MVSKTIAAAKRNPGIAMFITIGSMAGAALAIWQLGGVVDSSVVTHAELTAIFQTHTSGTHAVTNEQIGAIRQESRCESTAIQIAILSDVIWRLEQTEPGGIRLVEKRAEMVTLRARWTTLKCAELA